ncbi:hypothetical protein BKA67DRAFT_529723 [Truncatella angustata]|uniref:Uncharacterized protein n=1 Tax=Truncatella angustata TaxID=152316 RepID=A0A9P8UWQ9_9PEZI|nr:uncharacterized protein BKA67DRAFT_529723 [Truncatella angustata]KAH6659580.1 hypothetical protein BKA67DRAFT_529723 [Truncatella angustata]
MASLLRDGRYAPPIPSPLNPTGGLPISTHQYKRNNHSRVGARKPSGLVSPTQRLMRQKAAEAWRSLSSNNTVHSATSATVIRGLKPEMVDISRRQSFVVADRSSWREEEEKLGVDGRAEQPIFFDAFDGGNMGLGIVTMDIEKQPLLRHYDSAPRSKAAAAAAAQNVLPLYEHRPRGPTSLTRRRLILVVGIVCVIMLVSTFWPNKR